MATVGQPLTSPEAGWRRYDDTHPAIKYTGASTSTYGTPYQGSYTVLNQNGAKAEFKFQGTKIRIISLMYNGWSTNIGIKINGVTETFSENSPTTVNQALVYEKNNLPNTIHTVEIYRIDPYTGNQQIGIDAIDIDDTGRLLHPDEVTDIADLDVGKRIRCHYQASSGQVGVFSGLGQETSDFISPASSATPNGDFYWICVDRDYLGRWKLIADRNIQHSISWDTINSEGMTNTGREINL